MRPRGLCLALMLMVPTALNGCGGGSTPLTPAEVARKALQASLDAWKAGKPASSLADEKPSIEAVDFEWKAGKVLSDYTIDGETPGQGTQTFDATLTLKGATGPAKVQYMVLGLDPVRIYRDEDFNRAMNMDNAPASKTKSGR
jgi:hypothetical protein